MSSQFRIKRLFCLLFKTFGQIKNKSEKENLLKLFGNVNPEKMKKKKNLKNKIKKFMLVVVVQYNTLRKKKKILFLSL